MAMLLKLTNHAQQRIEARSIDIEHIKKAIKDPESKEKLAEDKIKVTKKIRRAKIVVVYKRDSFMFKKKADDVFVIITAYYL